MTTITNVGGNDSVISVTPELIVILEGWSAETCINGKH